MLKHLVLVAALFGGSIFLAQQTFAAELIFDAAGDAIAAKPDDAAAHVLPAKTEGPVESRAGGVTKPPGPDMQSAQNGPQLGQNDVTVVGQQKLQWTRMKPFFIGVSGAYTYADIENQITYAGVSQKGDGISGYPNVRLDLRYYPDAYFANFFDWANWANGNYDYDDKCYVGLQIAYAIDGGGKTGAKQDHHPNPGDDVFFVRNVGSVWTPYVGCTFKYFPEYDLSVRGQVGPRFTSEDYSIRFNENGTLGKFSKWELNTGVTVGLEVNKKIKVPGYEQDGANFGVMAGVWGEWHPGSGDVTGVGPVSGNNYLASASDSWQWTFRLGMKASF